MGSTGAKGATGARGAKGANRPRSAKRAGAGKVALVRALSKLGYASRSQAYELIRTGRVEVNGRPVNDRLCAWCQD